MTDSTRGKSDGVCPIKSLDLFDGLAYWPTFVCVETAIVHLADSQALAALAAGLFGELAVINHLQCVDIYDIETIEKTASAMVAT